MADWATIDRNYVDSEYRDNEEQLHGDRISDNYRRLVEPSQPDASYQNETYGYNPSVRMYGAETLPQRTRYRESYDERTYSEPVVPSSPEAPSAAQRLNDYVPIHRGMTSFTRMGDMRDMQQVTTAAPATGGKKILFDGLTYQNGELVDLNAPVAPVIDSSYMPAGVIDEIMPSQTGYSESEEDDARPTPATLSTLDGYKKAEMMVEQPVRKSEQGFFSSLSVNARIALIAVAAVVVVMIALICVNTAVLGSLKAGIDERQEQVRILEDQANDIQSEIAEITSPENIADWAISNGLVPQA